ncbi:hypothetical protein JCGZ_18219 [Jatropha curcas]|uniref:Uncharacterized protein n=1 Tax=Jatropha curcas TaxID=180498 RepID=A0A067K2H0_JATCU|nr:hypothetical protein JCGZ_18219 [Jatropha curcas]
MIKRIQTAQAGNASRTLDLALRRLGKHVACARDFALRARDLCLKLTDSCFTLYAIATFICALATCSFGL